MAIGKYDGNSLKELAIDIQRSIAKHKNPALITLGESIARDIHENVIDKKYEPKINPDELRHLRDVAVLNDFTGRNREEVIKKHGISRRLFYNILSRRYQIVQQR